MSERLGGLALADMLITESCTSAAESQLTRPSCVLATYARYMITSFLPFPPTLSYQELLTPPDNLFP
jgi:hypothetical protein